MQTQDQQSRASPGQGPARPRSRASAVTPQALTMVLAAGVGGLGAAALGSASAWILLPLAGATVPLWPGLARTLAGKAATTASMPLHDVTAKRFPTPVRWALLAVACAAFAGAVAWALIDGRPTLVHLLTIVAAFAAAVGAWAWQFARPGSLGRRLASCAIGWSIGLSGNWAASAADCSNTATLLARTRDAAYLGAKEGATTGAKEGVRDAFKDPDVLDAITSARHGPGSKRYDPVRAAAGKQGIDIGSVGASDFKVSVEEWYMMLLLRVETSDVLEALAAEGMLEARVGTRPWSKVFEIPDGGLAHQIDPKDVDADGPVELRLVANDGHSDSPSYGPFRYDISISRELASRRTARLDSVKRVTEDEAWLVFDRYGGWRFSNEFASDLANAVDTVEIGRAAGNPGVVWKLPRGGLPVITGVFAPQASETLDFVKYASESIELLMPLMDASELYGRLTFLNGRVTEWRRFSKLESALSAQGGGTNFVEVQELRGKEQLPGLQFGILDLLTGEEGASTRFRVTNLDTGVSMPIDVVPQHLETARIDQWYLLRHTQWGPVLPLGWKRVGVDMLNASGAVLATKVLAVPSPGMTWTRLDAAQPEAPALYGHVAITFNASLRLLPELPPGTIRVFVGAGGPPVDTLNVTSNSPYVTWQPPDTIDLAESSIRLVLQMEDGSEQGPFDYALAPVIRMVQEAGRAQAIQNRSRLLQAFKHNGTTNESMSHPFMEALQASRLPHEQTNSYISDPHPGVYLLPRTVPHDIRGWEAVSAIRYGTTRESISKEQAVQHRFASMFTGYWGPGPLPAGSQVDVLQFPHDTERVFVQFVLFDGTVTEPVELQPQTLE